MKKLSALMIAFFLLLPCLFLSACAKSPSGAVAPDPTAGELTASPTAETAVTAKPYKPYEAGMTYHEVYDPETDFDNRFGRGDFGVAETEDAYYFQPFDSTGGYLYYFDKATGESGPLCGKPECTHTGDSCSAKLHGRAGTLSCLNGRLYYIVENDGPRSDELSRAACYSVALDGTDRRREFKMPCEFEDSAYTIQLHRGKFYGAGYMNAVTEGKIGFHLTVTGWDAETGEFQRIFSADRASAYSAPRLFFFGKYIYFCFDANAAAVAGGGYAALEVWRFDTETGALENVFTGEMPGCRYTLWVEAEDRIYVMPTLPNPDVPAAAYLINGGELSTACEFGDYGGLALLDGAFQWYYGHPEDGTFELRLVDFDGNNIYSGSVDLGCIGEALPGYEFAAFYGCFGDGHTVIYCVSAEERDGGGSIDCFIRMVFPGGGAEPTVTFLCAAEYSAWS
ncbi:MAG: hypothetical protein J5544_02825 [Clostridia bacterium]|nr:hypothetical protein [Clostridia bacterium]